MSKRSNLTPKFLARLLAVSVLPQPVGPINTKDPIGLFSDFKPACATIILSTTS